MLLEGVDAEGIDKWKDELERLKNAGLQMQDLLADAMEQVPDIHTCIYVYVYMYMYICIYI